MSIQEAKAKKRSVTAEELFGAGKGLYEELDIPELGGVVYLRQLSAAEVIKYADVDDAKASVESKTATQNAMIAKALVNADGNRLISDDQVDRVTEMPIKLYMRLSQAITKDLGEATGLAAALAPGDVAGSPQEADSPNQ